MGTSKRVPGHVLRGEGAPFTDCGHRIESYYGSFLGVAGEGRGKCSCGALSEVLPSAYKRKQWHREHKAEATS